jgi:hypothetical protein
MANGVGGDYEDKIRGLPENFWLYSAALSQKDKYGEMNLFIRKL